MEEKRLTNRQKNLRMVRRLMDKTQDELDAATGGTMGRTYSYEKGNANPPVEYLKKAATFLKVDVAIFDRDDIFQAPLTEELTAVPYWGVVPCGDWDTPHGDPTFVSITGKVAGMKNVVAVRIGGESLYPLLKRDDVVPVKLTKRPTDGAIVLARNEKNDLTMKVARYRGGVWKFEPINPEYDPVSAEQIEMVGQLLQVPERFDPEGITI